MLGYWHTIITPPMTFAKVVAEVVEEYRAKRDREADRGLARRATSRSRRPREYLFDRGVPAYPYTTETPVEVLAAKYRWARMAGLLDRKR